MPQETKLGSNLAGYSIRVLPLALAAMIFGLGVWAQELELLADVALPARFRARGGDSESGTRA